MLIEAEGDRLVTIRAGSEPPAGARRLPGLVLPGLGNAHSHAFQRALRGRSETGLGDFWTWRELMYSLAGALDPDLLFGLARAAYGEMALAGYCAAGEFHYLHHGAGGKPYSDPNAMSEALIAAAAAAGLRLTLLDACYLQGGLDGRSLEGVQLRFGDGSAAAWAERLSRLRPRPGLRVGAAIHSVRAVDPAGMAEVVSWAAAEEAPLHAHVSEQPAENRDSLVATGLTPAALLDQAGALGRRFTAVHATHLSEADIALLGGTRSTVCLCPTTERDLADGVGPAAALASAGSPLCVGSDSQAVIDPFEEARAIELDERLAGGKRGRHRTEDLLAALAQNGMAALGWDSGRLEPGRLADFVHLGLDSVRLAGWKPDDLPAQAVYAATGADVRDLVVGGREIVADGRHLALGDVAALLNEAVARALAALISA